MSEDEFEVGKSIYRPLKQNRGYIFLCDIPAEAAWTWLEKACPQANPSLCENVDVEKARSTFGWADQNAVIVCNNGRRVTALYRSDGMFFVLQTMID